ncbi:MFS transporter [Saccharopolyspora sp. NPDC000995]
MADESHLPVVDTDTPAVTLATAPGGPHGHAKKALIGAWFGFFVDLFDIYLPVVALAPAIGYFIHADLGASGITMVSGMIFAATLIGRPIGAMIFGWLADTAGRKRTTVIALSGAGVATLTLALLPGYQQIGITSLVLFIGIRLLGGVFLGGVYTGANPLAMEAAPREKRGLYGGIINTGFPLAYVAVSLITLVLLFLIPSGGSGSDYAQWGWRIPFVIGGLLTFAMVVYYVRSVHEPEAFASNRDKKSSPIKQLFAGDNAKSFGQVFLLMTGFWLSLQPVAAALPILLGDKGVGLSSRTTTVVLVIAYLLLAPVDVVAAVVSQRVGRRRFLIWASTLMATFATILYFLLVSFAADSTTWAVVTSMLIVFLVVGPWGVLPAYLNERFPTSVRATGYGLAYSLSVVAPSFYAFYQAGLSSFIPFNYTGGVLIFAGALLILFGAVAGPETRDLDFDEI